MSKKLPRFALSGLIVLALTSCNDNNGGSNSADTNTGTPIPSSTPVSYVNADAYTAIRAATPEAAALFTATDAIAGADKCDVQVLRMTYNTVGGKGEATTSSGAIMLPRGAGANCSGVRPTLLYAHGTDSDSRYDLSQFMLDPTNPASSEALLLLALYAARGYIVVAPNYAGYADSTLDYHPFLDEAQQSSEMMTALATARADSAALGAGMSADLFVTGVSQGGYVAMATHKALQARGESVRASVPISGPYTLGDAVDAAILGYVNGGATLFTPMLLTALQRAHGIYASPDEVYSPTFAASAENSLPRPGGFGAAVGAGLLPASALLSGPVPTLEPPLQPFQTAGFGSPALLSDTFRATYLADLQLNGRSPANPVRILLHDADLRDWTPTAPVMMCGSENDPVVYFSNTQGMAKFWAGVPTVLTLNLDATPSIPPLDAFAGVTQQWQKDLAGGAIAGSSLHGQTATYCGLAAYGFFQSQRTQ